MDKHTILEIIKMLQDKLDTIGCTIGYIEENTYDSTEELKIQESTLILFRDHLQSFIKVDNNQDYQEQSEGFDDYIGCSYCGDGDMDPMTECPQCS